MKFQIGGDYHFGRVPLNIEQIKKVLKPEEKQLILTGDIIQAYTKSAHLFYRYCADNWEKVYVMMGNTEYECLHDGAYFSMKQHEFFMKDLLCHINKEVGSEKLIFFQNSYVDISGVRLAGLTLWPDDAITMTLKKEAEGKDHIQIEYLENNIILHNENTRQSESYPFYFPCVHTYFKGLNTKCDYLMPEDFFLIQEHERVFLKKMIKECSKKELRLIIVSHVPPTDDLVDLGNWKHFNFKFFCRDETKYIVKPIISWICGHVHVPQIVSVNGIPIYINQDFYYTP